MTKVLSTQTHKLNDGDSVMSPVGSTLKVVYVRELVGSRDRYEIMWKNEDGVQFFQNVSGRGSYLVIVEEEQDEFDDSRNFAGELATFLSDFEAVRSIQSFQDAGVLTNDDGFVITTYDNSEFQITVTKSR